MNYPGRLASSVLIAFSVVAALIVGEAQLQADEAAYDVVVYGDSSGAVTAAVAAKRQGRSVVLVNPTHFLGGMSASGLGATDFLGQRATFGGIASEFYDAIAAEYGQAHVRSFEPHVGQQVFKKLVQDAGVTVVFNEKINRQTGVEMVGQRIVSITTLSGKTYRGRIFIDATYVGDLMAAAGVTYTVGREAESQYGESLAGVRRGDTDPRIHYRQGDKDHFIVDVDPYVIPGKPESGLLPHVHRIENLENGQGDRKIQAYNYRLCLTTDPDLRVPIENPDGYREIDHELLLRNFEAGDSRLPALVDRLAGSKSKVDWNNMHAIGSDYDGANWEYPEASYEKRRQIEAAHELYIRGFLWTLSNSPRVPAAIRNRVAGYGLAKDEFTDNGGWPYMIYIREARRMVADYVMTQADCEGKRIVADPVGLGSFGMDSHVVQLFVNEKGFVRHDGVIWHVPPKPYGISYRSIIPKIGECENLLAPICLSTSHVAHGSIRMEPVFMVLSQSAATAAGVALDKGISVQEVEYADLRKRLDAENQIVQFVDVSKRPKQLQKPINLSGIVVDDTDASKTGDWTASTYDAGFVGASYVHDGNAGKGNKVIRYEAKLPRDGGYEVRMSYTSRDNRATNVPVTIHHVEGRSVVKVNQRDRPGLNNGFHSLGTFSFASDKLAGVEISTSDTDGYVIADAVQWVAVNEPVDVTSPNAVSSSKAVGDAGSRPNIVVILADDLGIECLSSYGGNHHTPNIDKLAMQGMRFTHCFSNPYCSPSRANLLTGRYPFMNGLTEVIFDERAHANTYLHTDQPSFARQLKQAGYTTAIAGKWQLSFLHQRNTIADFGFDQYQCWQIFRSDKSKTTRFHQPHFNRNGNIIADEISGRYGPEVNAEFLINFIKTNAATDKPFLAYYTSLLPHFPWVPTPDSKDQSYQLPNATHKGNPKFFPDMVTYLDRNVGRIMQTLEQTDIDDNTAVIFLADNGTDRDLKNQWGDEKVIAGGKGTMTDRGTHVPLIVRWPKHIQAGSTCDDLIDFSDLFPTLCDLAGAPLPREKIHGRSFLPQLLSNDGSPRAWVHVQDKGARHVRNKDYILNNKNQLRSVVEIWEPPAKPDQNKYPEKERAARLQLQAVFDALGK